MNDSALTLAKPGTSSPAIPGLRDAFALSLATVAAFGLVKLVIAIGVSVPEARLPVFVAACLFAVAFSSLPASILPAPVLLVHRGILALFICYLALAEVPVVAEALDTRPLLESRVFGAGAAAIGLLALWRLAWAVPFLLAAKWQKAMLAEILEIRISPTDYSPVLEFGLVLALGGLLWNAGLRLGWWRNVEKRAGFGVVPTPLEMVFLTAIAAHFSNYFYSAVQKADIGEAWWQWILENPTHNLAIAAWEMGNLPLRALGDDAAGYLVELLERFVVPLNGGIFIVQVLAIVAIVKMRWALIGTALYDVTHVGIFLASGIFFYKWIWLNLLLVLALSRLSHRQIPAAMGAWLVAVVLVAPAIWFVAFLGWFDTLSLNHERVEAIDESGAVHSVPTNYFLAGSITHGQQSVVTRKTGHFPTYAYGVLLERDLAPDLFEAAQRCEVPVSKESGAIEPEADRIARILRRHHDFVLSRADSDGYVAYDLFPHHIFSMPFDYGPFLALDKRRIVAYRYILESKCLEMKDGRPASKTVLRGELLVPVR